MTAMPATTAAQLAAAIKNRRLELGLSQTQLARAAGMRQKTVSEFETRPDDRTLKTLFRLMSALQLELGVGARPAPDERTTDPDRW